MIKIADKPWQIIGLRPANLLRKRLWDRCFPVNFAKFIRTRSLVIDLGTWRGSPYNCLAQEILGHV